MKNLIIVALLLFTSMTFANVKSELPEVREVLKFVESRYNPDAVGDNGASYGILQIQHGAIKDVNRIYGTNYTHEDAFNIACAEEIFDLYVTLWSSYLEKREGRKATKQDIVRIWNGGPIGYKKNSTWKYYQKFKNNSYICDMGKNNRKCIVGDKLGIVTQTYTHTLDVYLFKEKRTMCGVKKSYVRLLPKDEPKRTAPDPSQMEIQFG